MKPSSAKNKGRKLQQFIRDAIRSYFGLADDDVESRSMGAQGTDILLSEAAKKYFPYSIEAKNQQNISIWASLKQAEANTKPKTKPILIFKRNHSDVYVTIRFEDFLELHKKPSLDNPDL